LNSAQHKKHASLPYEKRHETNRLLEKAPPRSPSAADRAVGQILERARFLGYTPEPSHKILDFGCGIGHSVGNLVNSRGLDAYGVDVYEFWGSENEYYFEQSEPPEPDIAERLHKLHAPAYDIPFPDDHFDFVFSSQVFEHILDRRPAFSEIRRVLKPGGLSVNIFPGPWNPREPHIGLPLIPLCYSRWYLTLWALLGYRTKRQKKLNWRETVSANLDTMQYCHYPRQNDLVADATEAGVSIYFAQADWLDQASNLPGRLLRLAKRLGVGRIATRVLGGMAQRMMIIRSE
jgi:SAM-dependent methyltransferase